MIGIVKFVGAGPGDPELITLKGWRALRESEVILYDSLIDPRLLEGIPAEKLFVGKRRGRHSMPQEEINDLLATKAEKGKLVVRLKGGDPVVLGRLGEEILHLEKLGIPYEIIPGVTSATAVPCYAGIPITHRGLADSFTVATAHRRFDDLDFSIPNFNPRNTVVLLMALGTVELWRAQLQQQGYPPELPVAFVSSGCTEKQQVVVTTVERAVEDLKTSNLISPTLAVVGMVVTLREKMQWFEPDDKFRPPWDTGEEGWPLATQEGGPL